jgi:NAD-dependent SIR2 family protein deacetylase
MEKKGYVQHWLQQNHDGLAQKSGYPMKKLNEIHGSWFDKKNPVVMMDDSLKPKNFEMLKEWEEKVDVCLALGTSLCGMRSDGIAQRAS